MEKTKIGRPTKEEKVKKRTLAELNIAVGLLETKLKEYKQKLTGKIIRCQSSIDVYTKRVFAEWMVEEEDGEWGSYTGNFYCGNKDQKELILQRARDHYEVYFEQSRWHKDRRLGLFLTHPSGKKELVEIKEVD